MGRRTKGTGLRRPWKVCPGYRVGIGQSLTFHLPGNGIPMRSYATEVAARAAARALVTPDEDGNHFAAARLWGPLGDDWPIGVVEQYLPDDDNPPGQDNPRRIDLLDAGRRRLNLPSLVEESA